MTFFLIRMAVIAAFFYFIARFFGLFDDKDAITTDKKKNSDLKAKLEECPKCKTYVSDLKSHKCKDVQNKKE